MNAPTRNSSFDSTGAQFAWDATSLSLAQTCLRKYQLRMLERWTHPNKSVHLVFGGIYASAMEHFHKHLANGADREEALRLVVHEALVATWEHELDDAGNRIPGTGKPWDSLHNTKTRENLIRTIVWYFDQFSDDSLETVHLANGKPAVELSFSFVIDKDYVLCGHMDRVVEYSGDKYVQDQKTTGTTLSPRYFSQYDLDVQMSCYSFAGKAVFDIPVKGVVIDAAQIAVGFSRFERGFTFRSQTQLDEWYDQTLWWIEHVRNATRENYFPMNLSSCDKYGGCEFRDICKRSPEVRERFLKAEFTQGEPWDPLQRR